MKKTIGGDRLGSGSRMTTELHGYGRSTHDLGHIFKTTMSPGTLVPFLVQPALPGDTWDIDLDSIVKTHPTIGPLFGSFKLQLDVFTCPIRLYNSWLHNNRLEIGLKMSEIKFPTLELNAPFIDFTSDVPPEFQQINQSSLLAYLGIRGLARVQEGVEQTHITTTFNAIPYIAYWDIFKNYYANKQEDYAYFIHGSIPSIDDVYIGPLLTPVDNLPAMISATWGNIIVGGNNISVDNVELQLDADNSWHKLREFLLPGAEPIYHEDLLYIIGINPMFDGETINASRIGTVDYSDIVPHLQAFTLDKIDTMRDNILHKAGNEPYEIKAASDDPYGKPITIFPGEGNYAMYSKMAQEGLAVKTYQSDIFNNWIKTDWIEGAGSIADITKISTAGDSFTLDTLNLSKKVYDMLNRIAISGGTYQDWVETVYDNQSHWRAETPVYEGGLSKEIVFQEVISNAATADEPLGTLAGKGVMSGKHKGGKMVINVSEPSYIIGIVSITPRLDYSQGNEWHTHLETMDDLHKPALDGIGFQDLIEDQMSFVSTITLGDGSKQFFTAGKQPAWLNYMTAYNRNYGNFADPRSQMFMTLDRRYRTGSLGIEDLTTYIDPAKYNYAFAHTDLAAMNFWVQIAMNITARRKMSAKIIPNL